MHDTRLASSSFIYVVFIARVQRSYITFIVDNIYFICVLYMQNLYSLKSISVV